MKYTLLLLLVAISCVSSSPTNKVQMEADVETYNEKLSSWKISHKPSPKEMMKLTVAIRIEDDVVAKLEKELYELSDPRHVRYGKHKTVDEITELLNVPESRFQNVQNFFIKNGVKTAQLNPNKDMVTIEASVETIETILSTTIHAFQHNSNADTVILRASKPYFLPSSIASEIFMVGELLQFPRLRMKSLVTEENQLKGGSGSWGHTCDDSACDGLVTPQVLMQRYNFPNDTVGDSSNSMAVAEFQGQYFSPGDNQRFTKSCHRDVQVETIIGGNSGSQPGVEASLDIEYIRGVSPEIPLTVIYSGQYSLLNWANLITSNKTSPHVHSVSYGNDEKQQSSRQYMLTCNVAFMKAGVAGKSILFASGDQGVCGREGCGIFKKRFKPDFPGGSPYITVVGGTNFHNAGIGEEEVWNDGGGGFSDNFPIPQYQASAVAAYKNNKSAKLPDQSLWNNTGRGYPDIAALAGQKTPYCVVSGGNTQGVAGTSAACPVAAGVFAKLNGVRLKANKPVLGFLNPFIYQNPQGFHDVTIGCNGCQGGIFSKKGNGFTAIAGWDAASGFGTPNFDALSKLV
jgi:tripeptidyl-peptidase I